MFDTCSLCMWTSSAENGTHPMKDRTSILIFKTPSTLTDHISRQLDMQSKQEYEMKKLRERERDQVRRMSLHKEEKHPCAIRAEPTQPTLQRRQEETRKKKGTMFSQKFTNYSATLHPYLRRPSFLTDNVQMLPIADSSFPHPAHMVSQKQVQVEHGSIDALDVFIMNSRVPSASIDECLH